MVRFITLAVLVTAAAPFAQISQTAPVLPRPAKPLNVLIIMSDQHTVRAMGSYENGFGGLTQSLTPNLDKLAQEGARFDQAFCASGQCAPSRYSILTGRWPHNHGLRFNNVWEPRDQTTFPELAREMGYVTATFGKHHMSWLSQPNPRAEDLGFDVVVGWGEYVSHCFQQGEKPFSDEGRYWQMPGLPEQLDKTGYTYNTNEFHPAGYWADQVIDFLEDRAGPDGDGRPFVCWYTMFGPHDPVLPTGPAEAQDWAHEYHPWHLLGLPPNLDKTATTTRLAAIQSNYALVTDLQWQEVLSYYYGLVTQIDWNIGRVLGRLEQLNLADDTIVIYTSDHGEMGAEMRCWKKGTGSYDAVTRIPLLMRLPGVIPAGKQVDQLVNSVDLFPTLVELTGTYAPNEVGAKMDGRSLVPLLLGAEAPTSWPGFVYSELGTPELPNGLRYRMVRTSDQKYSFDELNGGEEEFYDLVLDPYEIDNRIEDPDPSVQAAITLLENELDAWWADEVGHAPRYRITGTPIDPPVQAGEPKPRHKAIQVARDVDPEWLPCTGADTQEVWFGTDPTQLSPFADLVEMESSFNPGTLDASTTYYWRVDQINANGVALGDVWEFTTEAGGSGGPGLATDPQPGHHAEGVALGVSLQWTPAPDAVWQDVYFGPGSAPPLVAGMIPGDASAFDPGPVSAGAEYTWRVDSVDGRGWTEGTVWRFATDPTGLAGLPSKPIPRHLQSSVPPVIFMTWRPGAGAESHDVYFGTGFPLEFKGNQTSTLYSPGPLVPGNTYYWRVDEVNAFGTRRGWMWRFTVAGP